MITNEIGTAAGVVWRFLDQSGPASASRIKKELPLSPGMVERAIGWLAREHKIEESAQGRTTAFLVK